MRVVVTGLTYELPDSPKGKVYVTVEDPDSDYAFVAWGPGRGQPTQFKLETSAKAKRKVAEKIDKGYEVRFTADLPLPMPITDLDPKVAWDVVEMAMEANQ